MTVNEYYDRASLICMICDKIWQIYIYDAGVHCNLTFLQQVYTKALWLWRDVHSIHLTQAQVPAHVVMLHHYYYEHVHRCHPGVFVSDSHRTAPLAYQKPKTHDAVVMCDMCTCADYTRFIPSSTWLLSTLCSEKKWYILFVKITSQLQARFSYSFQWQLLSN